MKKYFFGWENIKKLVKELYNTLSSKPSHLSSKRIERMILSAGAVAITLGTWIYLMIKNTLTATDAIMLAGTLFVAAGYNMSQTQKEKKLEDEKTI